jgi:hypothetical protein
MISVFSYTPIYALDRSSSVACDGRDRLIRLDGGLQTYLETKRGILAVPLEQFAVDDMGSGGQGLRASVLAGVPRNP